MIIPPGSYGEQADNSIVDAYGNRISAENRLAIVETVQGLPATAMADEIVHIVENNPVTIIIGETGSGKTTQIPKRLHLQNKHRKIVTTQPRVLAAMSNSHRVADELLAETANPHYSIGHGVGYRTGR